MILVFKRARRVHTLDHAAPVIRLSTYIDIRMYLDEMIFHLIINANIMVR
jgi:hypothetical protein